MKVPTKERRHRSVRSMYSAMGVVTALFGGAAGLVGQQCPAGRSVVPSIGVETFHCRGGSCLVAGSSSTVERGLPDDLREFHAEHRHPWAFTVEPSLWEIDPRGPAAGRILEGDVLVAVEGHPVTTRAASRALTGMTPGSTLEVTVRRGGALVPFEIPVEGSCGGLTASAGQGDRPWTLRDQPMPQPPSVPEGAGLVEIPSLGLALLGEKQVTVGANGSVIWFFVEPPTVASVEPGSVAARAGIRPGERIVGVDGERLDTPAGIEEFLAAVRGERSILNVWVDRSARGVVLGGGA